MISLMMMGGCFLSKQIQPPNQPNVIFFVDLTSRPCWSAFTTPFCIDGLTNLLCPQLLESKEAYIPDAHISNYNNSRKFVLFEYVFVKTKNKKKHVSKTSTSWKTHPVGGLGLGAGILRDDDDDDDDDDDEDE